MISPDHIHILQMNEGLTPKGSFAAVFFNGIAGQGRELRAPPPSTLLIRNQKEFLLTYREKTVKEKGKMVKKKRQFFFLKSGTGMWSASC